MGYLFAAGIAFIVIGIGVRLALQANPRDIARTARWLLGGAAALFAAFLIVRGRIEIGAIVGAAAFSILRYGRLGPIKFESDVPSGEGESAVRSRYIAMNLDHATGEVTGKVIYGEFQGIDLIDLDEAESRRLLRAVANDPDSLSLLETWLDKNRAGWREWLASHPEPGADTSSPIDDDEQAYEVLGLKPGASADEIRAAHRKLMMGVHPDQGGSNFLASKINEAKDRLLKKVKS
jgi:hypothetical protein